MKMKNDIYKPIDAEERDLMEEIETGNFESVPNVKEEIAKAQKMAMNTLALLKNKNNNIRISGHDNIKIKSKAAEAGLPYQTLIASILHQYANEKFKIEI